MFVDETFASNVLGTREQLLSVMSRKMLSAHLKAGAIGDEKGSGPRAPSRAKLIGGALKAFDYQPEALADALHSCLGAHGLEKLLTLLTERATVPTQSAEAV